jgi:proton-dependent oligopeptide transporter, POT family
MLNRDKIWRTHVQSTSAWIDCSFFANMGERFGFYTMMAILVLFLQAQYGLSEEQAGSIYSWFYFGIYALALGFVFLVVIFFWMSFHQNGSTLTFFARDYTAKTVGPITNVFFDLKALLSVIAVIFGLVFSLTKSNSGQKRLAGLALVIAGVMLTRYFVSGYQESNAIEPETFQQFNPLFIVFLTPVFLALFSYLNKKLIEPSTPKKIGIGMIIAAIGCFLILFASIKLPSPLSLAGLPFPDRVSPYWLINSYLVMTMAELFLSPMGLSFVSKVSPPRVQGLMQGGWLGATAIGNKLLFVGSYFWGRVELWQLWAIFTVCCLMSASLIFIMMKRLEAATSNA